MNGRGAFFRLVDFEYAKLWDADDPLAFAIRKIELDYKKPARVDDHLTIVTTYDRIKGARLWVSQACYRGDELLVTGMSEASSISREGRPKRVSKFMLERTALYLEG